MKVLIVGNGFDLAHHLPTRWSDFKEHIQKPHRDAGDAELKKLLVEYELFDDYEFWGDVESEFNNLYNINIDAYNNIYRIFAIRFQHYLANKVNAKLRNPKLDFFNGKYLQFLKEYDVIISYNYTNTIEELYGDHLPNTEVIHIHGKLKEDELDKHHIIIGYDRRNIVNKTEMDDGSYDKFYSADPNIDKSSIVAYEMYLENEELFNTFHEGHDTLTRIQYWQDHSVDAWGFSFSDCDNNTRKKIFGKISPESNKIIFGPRKKGEPPITKIEAEQMGRLGIKFTEMKSVLSRSNEL